MSCGTSFPKGHIVRFEPTRRGRERAVAMITADPMAAQTVARLPHHVELVEPHVLLSKRRLRELLAAAKTARDISILCPE